MAEHIKWLFERSTRLIGSFTSYADIVKFHNTKMSEVCFIGRSNVGKSSLINSLLGKSHLKVSPTPGETKALNFWRVGKDAMILVDMPGYGFAYSKEEVMDKWSATSKEYLAKRKQLKQIFLLIDSRHGLKVKDDEMIEYLEKNNCKYQILLTKVDLSRGANIGNLSHLTGCHPNVLKTSSETNDGIDELRERIFEYSNFDLKHWRENVKKNVVYHL